MAPNCPIPSFVVLLIIKSQVQQTICLSGNPLNEYQALINHNRQY